MTRKAAAALWHKARAWDRETHQRGRHGGIIGRTALAVFYALAFDFQNFRTGRLDPSHDAIAAKIGCCARTVRTALVRLRDLGMLSWLRRCREDKDEAGRFQLKQETNAYSLTSPSQWRGYRDNTPPQPTPDTLGAPERVPDPIEAAVAELTRGQRKASLAALETDPGDALTMALAAFGRAIEEREIGGFTGRQPLPRNIPLCLNSIRTDQFAGTEPAPQPPVDDIEAAKQYWLHALLGTDKPN